MHHWRAAGRWHGSHGGNRGDMYPVMADGTFQMGSKQVGWSAFANTLFTMPWSSSQRAKYYSSNSECCLSLQTTGFWNWGSIYGSAESQVRKPKVQHNERARNMWYFIFPLWWFSVLCQTNFPCGRSNGKESACNAEDPGLISGSGRSPGEANGKPLQYSRPGKLHGQERLPCHSPQGRRVGYNLATNTQVWKKLTVKNKTF